MYQNFGCFVGGEWCKGSETLDVFSPVTEKPLGTIAAAGVYDTHAALDAAALALGALREMGGFARAEALHKIADEMIARTNEAAQKLASLWRSPNVNGGSPVINSVGMPKKHGAFTAESSKAACRAVASKSRMNRLAL